ncbi:hypothetical protein EDD70_3006 [Hydrogenoanaerobacterium saccharovorans]|uniref:Zona occludens toxin N-terminal domain-containing protein n=1 Tax=Hydrogenoanaerobacterium saccharovorans TaxID=474960 RepID=A0A1H8EHY1_9FIRM|nr:hypothetical protein [Hydrogenoanaerobacterium saccharovorans]RPF41880.1 hypothetical protein EDD70_3006 [Hydrogenoanaerobacterium saccharovorans]SEN19181.1 hypothetical protein SAMN05216180_3030 [Hydrogenoanaerobacterium saccharovorans]
MNIASSFSGVSSSLLALFGHLLFFVFKIVFLFVLVYLFFFCISCKCVPFFKTAEKLKQIKIKNKWFCFTLWVLIDVKEYKKNFGKFNIFGLHLYVGRQRSGKTIAMVNKLNAIKNRYPNCVIVTNFKYQYADYIMTDWLDLLNIRNGEDGVVFAIDEIHSEYSASDWKDVPDSLLSEISQQGKQRVCILATTQFFSRVAKPIREQAFSVITCRNIAKRLIIEREYDALEYSAHVDNPLVAAKKLKTISKSSFVATDYIRNCYDTYEKINRMRDKQMKSYKKSISVGD